MFGTWIPISVVLSGVITGTVLWLLCRIRPVEARARSSFQGTGVTNFLLRDGLIEDHDLPDQASTVIKPDDIKTWSDLRSWLTPRFRGLPKDLAQDEESLPKDYNAVGSLDDAIVEIHPVRGNILVKLTDPAVLTPAARHQLLCEKINVDRLKSALQNAPTPICIIDHCGEICWRNVAFDAFTAGETELLLRKIQGEGAGAPHIIELKDASTGGFRHFELQCFQGEDASIVYAVDVSRLIEADKVRGAFIQTLTKTFADLATGLAVFDRNQCLVLFNPAILDLTGLSAEFLSGRPSMIEFFDHLRDRQILPEPKSYSDWREQIQKVIESAAGGRYSEAWSLPNGLTYRLTGRPHPDGAVAFLMEDISDEVSFSRRTRNQLETRQAVLDRIEDAIAVFSSNGLLVFCNCACRNLLGFDPDSGFNETMIQDLIAVCEERFPDASFWRKLIRDLARDTHLETREAVLSSGSKDFVRCRLERLPGGFLMLSLCSATEPLSLTA